jgi:hypothetical protein
MDMTRLEQFVEELNKTMFSKYQIIKDVFETEYGYPELDPIRNEICKCIICNLNQAAITLTNHLLEKSLKHFLIVKYSKENKREDTKIDDVFKDGIDRFDTCDLEKSINMACTQGLITKEQKKLLKKFKDDFRNPYSHASAKEIFKDMPIKGKSISLIEGESGEVLLKRIFDDSTEYLMPAKYLLPAQGIVQYCIAQRDSVPYFVQVDNIIRNITQKMGFLKE